MSPDPESMFDFLDDEAANVTRARPVAAARREEPAERTLPIIRKPVPVSESGPLRAPSADAPRGAFDDDFDFLGERPGGHRPSYGTSVAADADGRGGGRLRAALLLLGLALLAAGAIVAAWPYLPPVGNLLGGASERTADVAAPGEGAIVADAAPTPAVEPPTPGPAPATEPAAPAGPSLGERFRDELRRVEALVADGRFEEAERALATMDRVVYGYGIAEFSTLETRIAARDGGATTDDATALADAGAGVDRATPERGTEQARAAEAARLEAERAAERSALDAEAEQREAARREAEQLAAARREAERLADAERRAENERRADSERPADAERDPSRREQLEAERRAREAEAARARAEAREAARRRAEALAGGGAATADASTPDGGGEAAVADTPAIDADAAATTAVAAAAEAEEAQRVADEREADRLATDRRIAEQRAAAAAEERRIAALETPAEPRRRAQIDDEDLQTVYASLLELKRAVEDRDIASVIALSDPPSGRVQQLLQIFANSASIRTRITNVSARPADDTVTGTLRIEDIRRADGSSIRTPPELESVALTSTRQGDGWSSLSW